ncbi:MAG: LPS export ABC transporter periplasmic protein LptC [SAR324 cluster bacterium]|nr:LPS export ABC transporter periplasmic protein LptC [SAR324 cluster bacterium]
MSAPNNNSFSYMHLLWKNKKEILILCLLLTLLSYAMTVWNGSDEISEQTEQIMRVLTMEQVEITNYKQELLQWKIIGSHARAIEETQSTLLRNLTVLIYDEEQTSPPRVDIQITAEQGLLEGIENHVILMGNVHATRDEDMSLKTEKAIYNYQNRILTLPENVSMHRGEITMIGDNLEYHVFDKQFHLGNVLLVQ